MMRKGMHASSPTAREHPVREHHSARREVKGVALGILIQIVVVASVVVGVILLGASRGEDPNTINLTPWLWLELAVGVPASVAAGAVCKTVGGRRRPVFILAGLLLMLSVAESIEIHSYARSAGGLRVVAPPKLLLFGPPLVLLGVLAGGRVANRVAVRECRSVKIV